MHWASQIAIFLAVPKNTSKSTWDFFLSWMYVCVRWEEFGLLLMFQVNLANFWCRQKRQFPSVMSIPHLLRTWSTARQLFRTEFDCYLGTYMCREVLKCAMKVTDSWLQCIMILWYLNELLDSAPTISRSDLIRLLFVKCTWNMFAFCVSPDGRASSCKLNLLLHNDQVKLQRVAKYSNSSSTCPSKWIWTSN